MYYLSSVYIVSKPLNISGVFVANHQEVYCTYTVYHTVYLLMMGYKDAQNM